MKYGLAILMATLAIGACGSVPPRRASASQILATTKQLTAKDCGSHSEFGHGLWVSRCSYAPPAFIDGEWGVIVRYILVDEKGNHVGVMGADSIYLFDKTGKFIKILPGM